MLEGADTECVVTILDEDKPGFIGFKERFITVNRKDAYIFVELERLDGADGDIQCSCTTINDVELLPGKQAAVADKDFIPFENQVIEFPHNSISTRIRIEMPDCEDSIQEEDMDIVSFAVHIHDPAPEGVRISRKNICFIDIEPENTKEDVKAKEERKKMIDYFVANKDITWG